MVPVWIQLSYCLFIPFLNSSQVFFNSYLKFVLYKSVFYKDVGVLVENWGVFFGFWLMDSSKLKQI